MSFLTATPKRMGKSGLPKITRNMTKALFLFFVMAALMVWQPPPTAYAKKYQKSQAQVMYEKGKVYFNSGDFKAAYEIFFILFKNNPGNPEVNFYLGRSAFETGDYEAAIMAFERILILKPDTGRVKLEIARCHLKLGSTEMGKKLLNEVLETHPPAEVKENIQNLLAQINQSQKKHFFNGMVSLSAGWDDNAATAPSQTTINYSIDQIDEYGTVTEISYPTTVPGAESDIIYSSTALLNHHYRPPDTILSWRSTAILYNSIYSEDGDLNINYFSGGTGPAIQTNRFYMDMKGFLNHMLLDGTEYLTSLGASSSASYLFTPRYLTNLTLKWENRNYVGDIPVDKDATNLNVTNSHIVKIGKSIFSVSIGYETEGAKNDENSYNRLESGLSYALELPYEITASTGYTFQKSDYEEEDEVFNNKRADEIQTIRVGMSKIFWQSASRLMTVSGFLDYAFTNAQSNQDPYDYTKNVVTLGGAFIF